MPFITNRVVDVCTLFSRDYNVSITQDCQLLGCVGRFNLKTLTNLVYSQFAISQSIQNGNSQRMSQGFKKLRLEVAKFAVSFYLPHS
jgi:hypothetical protein